MRVKVQLVICVDGERTDTIHDVAILEKDCQRIEQLGLTLSEAKQLLTQLQQHVLAYRPHSAGGLFTQLLRKRQFDYVTQDDEDTAQRRLKRCLYEGAPPVLCLASAGAKRRAG
jgi:hypothetical protein